MVTDLTSGTLNKGLNYNEPKKYISNITMYFTVAFLFKYSKGNT